VRHKVLRTTGQNSNDMSSGQGVITIAAKQSLSSVEIASSSTTPRNDIIASSANLLLRPEVLSQSPKATFPVVSCFLFSSC
jgi:hypothetical protein